MSWARARALKTCVEVEGRADIVDVPPRIHRVHGAHLVPMGLIHRPGLYADGKLVRAAAYYRGLPHAHFPLEAENSSLAVSGLAAAPVGPRYVFAGHLTGHYGHFLFSMLSRLWSLPVPLPADIRLVLLNGVNAPDLFELEFARSLFQAFGITIESFAAFREPVRFEEILVPEPAIEENHFGHPVFAQLCHRLGRVLLGAGDSPTLSSRPLFLSKRRVTGGVHKIVNEEELCKKLEAKGFEIVSPETLPFKEQLSLWATRPMVSGIFGSMLHTSIFCAERSYVALNPEPWINSNQMILDKLNRNSGRILFPIGGYEREPVEGFGHGLRLKDVDAVVRDFARAVEQVRGVTAERSRNPVARLFGLR